jgi:hypothetical protein
MVGEGITSGGGQATSGSGDTSSSNDAADELTDRDPGSGDGGDVDVPDSVYDDISGGSDSGGSSSGSSGGSDAADELERRDPGSGSGGGSDSDSGDTSQGAREELTDRDPGSGDGSSDTQDRSTDEGITSGGGETTTGDGGSDTDSDARDQLTDRDPGSGDGTASEEAEETLTDRDPGSESRPDEVPDTNGREDEVPDTNGREDDRGLVERARDEGLSTVERGGAVSEAGRNFVADTAGIVFQNPEESFIADTSISRRRLRRRNRNLGGPALVGIDFDREGYQSLELEYGDRGDVNEDVITGLTSGGGFLTDEERGDIQEDIEQRREIFGLGDEAASAAEAAGASETQVGFARGLGRLTGDAASVTAQATLGADTAVEAGSNLPGTVQTEGAGAVAGTTLEVAGRGVGNVIRGAQENPGEFAGSVVGGFAGGAAAGRVAGGATRFGRDRVRTAGAETFDIEDGEIVNTGTGSFYNPRSSNRDVEDRFPGAQDSDLYESDPPEAVRQQAEDFTPGSVDQRFEEAGVEGGSTLKKAVDVEPDDGPGRGFSTQEGSYESPGGFFGPELSPNFLGVESGRRSFSLRPGLPDTGDRATGVFVRTRVDRPDAENLDEFNEELLDRAGETTARTKPAGEVNEGEIEAVIPPEAEFADLGGGAVRATARRAGVGSDFAVRIGGRTIPGTDRKVGGRKIPIRPVADPDLVDSGRTRSFGDFLRSERGQLGADDASGPRTRTLGEIRRPARTATDRPLPYAPTVPTASGNETSSGSGPSRSTGSPTEPLPGFPSGGSGPASGGDSGSGSGVPSGRAGSPGSPGPSGGGSGGSPFSPPSSGGGSSGGGGSIGGGGSPAASSPLAPTTSSPGSRRDREEDTEEPDDPAFAPVFGGSRKGIYTDFLNPLSGERLETEVDDIDSEPDEPVLLGFRPRN